MRKKATVPAESGTSTGAPAVLRRLEASAAALELQIDDATARLAAMMALGPNGADKDAIASVHAEMGAIKDEYFKTAKTLLDYDKNVKAERREGEKSLNSEVREWVAQLILSARLATEQAILESAGRAALCDEADAFAGEVGPLVRSAFDAAFDAAKREGAVPKWITDDV